VKDNDLPEASENLEALVAQALVRRGELMPTTSEEVAQLEQGGIAFEGELPLALREYNPTTKQPSSRAAGRLPQASPRRAWGAMAATFVAGAAVAATALLLLRPRPPVQASSEPAGVATTASPAAPDQAPVLVIPPLSRCGKDCCAGADCETAKSDLTSCPTGRTCVGCQDFSGRDSAYRLRLGNFRSSDSVDPKSLEALDVCVRTGGSPWSCEPAYQDAVARPMGRLLTTISRAEDLISSVEIELRLRGASKAYGAWRSGIKLGPNVMCKGLGVVLEDDSGRDLGGLSVFLEDVFYVELARAASAEELLQKKRSIQFADLEATVIATTANDEQRYVLALGPFDRELAERVQLEMAANSLGASVTLGADYRLGRL
jgi:hypothetical protein